MITDDAVLDRFEAFGEAAPESRLTGKLELLVYDISTSRTFQISPEAADVSYTPVFVVVDRQPGSVPAP